VTWRRVLRSIGWTLVWIIGIVAVIFIIAHMGEDAGSYR
jgi:hypothetical protein